MFCYWLFVQFLAAASAFAAVLLNEGFAVNALTHSRVCLVGCNTNLIKSAIVFVAAVVFALLYGTFDGGVRGLVFHFGYLLHK